jgi:hypothetical protein
MLANSPKSADLSPLCIRIDIASYQIDITFGSRQSPVLQRIFAVPASQNYIRQVFNNSKLPAICTCGTRTALHILALAK